MVARGEEIYFLGWGEEDTALWRASRQSGRIDEIRRLPGSVTPSSLVLAGDQLFFLAASGGRELWTSDGTAAGTVPLTRFPIYNAIADEATLTALGGRVWFMANDSEHGWQLWGSDGTLAGTRRATDFTGNRAFGYVDEYAGPELPAGQLAWLGGRLLFGAVATSQWPRLWTTTGNWRSTTLLRGCPGGCPRVDGRIITIGNRAVFFGWRPYQDASLWVTDGTGPGTLLLPLPEPADDDTPNYGGYEIVAAGGRWFILNSDSLWVTDGTPAGTVQLSTWGDPWPGLAGSVAAIPGSVLFPAMNAQGLWGLWQTAGAGAR
jgi:ELWxxDGT repeat protein